MPVSKAHAIKEATTENSQRYRYCDEDRMFICAAPGAVFGRSGRVRVVRVLEQQRWEG